MTATRRRWIAGAVGLGVAVGAVVAVVLTGTSDETAQRPPASVARFGASGLVAVPGLEGRDGPAVAWTGARLFVFGGYRVGSANRRLLPDGALVDVETGKSEAIPRAPFAAPLLWPAATRSGGRVVVVGVECADFRVEEDSDAYSCAKGSGRFALATFDPARRRWTAVSRPPGLDALRSSPRWAPGRVEPGFWVPQVLGSDAGRTVIAVSHGATYEFWSHAVTKGSWTQLPSPGASSAMCVTGSRVAVMSETNAETATLRLLDLAAPAAQWEDTLPVELEPRTTPDLDLSCLGDRILVTNLYGDLGTRGRLYDLTKSTWTDVASPPSNLATAPDGRSIALPFTANAAQRIWTGTELLLFTDFPVPWTPRDNDQRMPGRAYNPTTNTWRVLPPMPARVAAPQWVGTAAVGYALQDNRSVIAIYRPT